MIDVYDLWLDDVQYLDVSESSRDYFERESRNHGAWDFNDGRSKKKKWEPIDLFIREPLLPKPDIFKMGNILLLEKDAFAILQSTIEKVGEVYEQPFEHRILYLFHVTYVLDVLETVDEFSEEGAIYHVNKIDQSIFRLPWGALRAITGRTPAEFDFINLVRASNLKGLRFRKIWSDEVDSK